MEELEKAELKELGKTLQSKIKKKNFKITNKA